VPALRICGLATCRAASARRPKRSWMSGLVSTSVSVVSAPISTPSAVSRMPRSSHERARLAALSWLLHSGTDATTTQRLAYARLEALLPGARAEGRLGEATAHSEVAVRRELALAGGLLGEGPGTEILGRLLGDEDEIVSGFAIRGVGRSGSAELRDRLVSMLGDPVVRGRIKNGLASAGSAVLELCERRLRDPSEEATIRISLAQVLAHVPEQGSADALKSVVADTKAPWRVRHASLKALNKLRAGPGRGRYPPS